MVVRRRRHAASGSISSRDVAAAARVSQSTVSRVINGSPSVRPETRERVEREMAALGYIPNAAARSLITRRTRLLGLVVSNITNGFYPEIIEAITSCALEHGYTVVVGSAGERPEAQAAYLRLLAEQRVDGIILTSALSGDAGELEAFVRTGPPIVLANRLRDDLPLDGVELDNEGAGWIATMHLLEHGRRAIAYVGGRRETSTDQGRRAGFERTLREAGLEPVGTPDDGGEVAFTREHGYEQTRRLITEPGPRAAQAPRPDATRPDATRQDATRQNATRPDAIVAADDTVALGCLDALAEAGLKVPDDIAVVGFDDIPAASLRAVWLTTVSTAARTMGTRAVELLIERIRDRSSPGVRREVLPARLVVRGTCGDHPASRDGGSSRARRGRARPRPNTGRRPRREAGSTVPTGGRS